MGTRVQQAGNAGRCDFNIAESEWTVHVGQDVAILLAPDPESGAAGHMIGRITRIRRRYSNGRWANYDNPVDLSKAKEDDLWLMFTLSYYVLTAVKKKGTKKKKRVYVLGKEPDTDEIHLSMIICPVAMRYDPKTVDEYSLPDKDVKDMIERGVAGSLWDYDTED